MSKTVTLRRFDFTYRSKRYEVRDEKTFSRNIVARGNHPRTLREMKAALAEFNKRHASLEEWGDK